MFLFLIFWCRVKSEFVSGVFCFKSGHFSQGWRSNSGNNRHQESNIYDSHNPSLLMLTPQKTTKCCLPVHQTGVRNPGGCECDGSSRSAAPWLYLNDLPDLCSCLPLPCMSTWAARAQPNLIEPTVLDISTRFMASFLNRETSHLLQLLPFPAVLQLFRLFLCFIYLHTEL